MSRSQSAVFRFTILAGCLLLTLAGCGGNTADPTATAAPDDPQPTHALEEPPVPSPTPLPDETPAPLPDDLENLPQPVRTAVNAAADDAGVTLDEVRLVEYDEREWPSTALGCPRPGFSYAQVVTPGYRVQIEAGGTLYEYHTNSTTSIVLCDTSTP